MESSSPIGIFDSGVGGTSIFKEIRALLPLESIIYLADSKNAPYGEKPKDEIIALSFKNVDLLLQMGCKLIVVACNTATTNAIDSMRKKYNVPIIGIEPAIKPAALNSQRKTIGILATRGTLASSLFTKTSALFARDARVLEITGSGLVEAIEAGKEKTKHTFKILKNLVQPLLDEEIDYLVLGCSHYPYLIPQLRKIFPKEVRIIDSGEAVARQTKAILEKKDLLAKHPGNDAIFYTNGNPKPLKRLIQADKNNFKVLKKVF